MDLKKASTVETDFNIIKEKYPFAKYYSNTVEKLPSYKEEEGEIIEPEFFLPIIPMILINGSEGIGTGFSTKMPPHDPEIIVRNLINLRNT